MNRIGTLFATFALGLGTLAGCAMPQSSSDDASQQSDAIVSGGAIAAVASANVGRGACSKNSQGGAGYDSSCTGNAGLPEYWCADFARWVWGAAGVGDLGGLSAAAGSFYVYGQNHGTLSSTPHVGDAVVFDYHGGGSADHVAIVTQVNGDSIVTMSGDWGGQSGSEAHFSSTSHVVENAPAYPGVVGSSPGIIGMKISGFISPSGVSEPPPAASPDACSKGNGFCTDTLQCDNGHWILRSDDPSACTTVQNVQESCKEGDGYCTATLQCDGGHWVPRSSDPDACTSGPG